MKAWQIAAMVVTLTAFALAHDAIGVGMCLAFALWWLAEPRAATPCPTCGQRCYDTTDLHDHMCEVHDCE